jgi:hypothetical protein
MPMTFDSQRNGAGSTNRNEQAGNNCALIVNRRLHTTNDDRFRQQHTK